MATANATQELFDLWRRSLEEGTQAWLKAMGPAGFPPTPPTAAPFDFAQFRRPLLTQGMDVWQTAAAQGKVSPEFMQQWKTFMDQWIEVWSKALGQAMATEGFAQGLGRYLDQFLAVSGPMKKAIDQYNDVALKTLGLPSRGQVVGVAAQVVGLEERIERLEDRLDDLKGLLEKTLRAVQDHEEAAQRRAPRPKEGE
jgi:Poly(R)-hydroxyalkanoic acid synthase subunit (PHA_synth_III_E)